jgi:hypothetical protein
VFRVKSPQDFGTALVFIAFGLAGAYFAKDLDLGTTFRIGPGYFPTALSWLIVALGIVLAIRSVAIDGPSLGEICWRPILFIVGAILLFAMLIEMAGLVLASMALTLAAAYARREANLPEALLLGAGLTVFVVVAFVYGLSQPLPLWWGR